jgi:hypothetical protein
MNSPTDDYKSTALAALDQNLAQLETALVDHAEARLTQFLLGGGFQQRLIDRMAAHHQSFAQSLGLPAAPKRSTRGLGFGPTKPGSVGPTLDVDLAGGNRDA